MLQSNEPARQYQIGEGEQRKELRVVLGHAAIVRLVMFEQAFHDMEAMLDFGAYAGLRVFQLFDRAVQVFFKGALRRLGRMAVCQATALFAFSGRLATS